MGLAGARNTAVTGLQSQSESISISADNIANASTTGYKALKAQFSSLVTNSSNSTSYSSGGVNVIAKNLIESQGLIESTGRVTDLAIEGTGFFAVRDDSETLFLTRAGSFDINDEGELVNASGFKLLGWPLDNDGLRPGEPGNVNTVASESADSLVVVDTDVASGTASATTTIEMIMNLDADQSTHQGATVSLIPESPDNSDITSNDIIVPAAGMQQGDSIEFTSNGTSTIFEYGGFATSADLNDGSIFGASTIFSPFSLSATAPTLANGDKFTITTASSDTVTFTFQQSSPDTSVGEFNSFDTLASAINGVNGLTARVTGTQLFISSISANESITFADIGSSNLVTQIGLNNVAAASVTTNRWNTFAGLEELADQATQLNATIINPSSSASIEIYASDPTVEMTVSKLQDLDTIDLTSTENGTISDTDLIVPVAGGDMVAGLSSFSLTAGGATDTFLYGGVISGDVVSATNTVFGQSDTSSVWTTGGAPALADGDTITLDDGSGVQTFTFQTVIVDPTTEFNSMDTLVTAINTIAGADFFARIVGDAIHIGANDASLGITVAGSNANIATELGLTTLAAGGANSFNTLAGLDALINDATNNTSTTSTLNAGVNATIDLVQTGGESMVIASVASSTTLLADLGLTVGSPADGFFTEMQIDDVIPVGTNDLTLEETYNPSDSNSNMAGGNITAHFPRNIRLYDAQGTGHDFRISYLKTGENRWAVEIYSLEPSEIVGRPDGLVASGNVEFNGDGSLASVSQSLTAPINITWTTGADLNNITLDLGTAGQPAGTAGATVIGLTDGLRQFDAPYNVDLARQNGVAAGQFKNVTVDEDGVVYAHFSNGEIKPIYQLPILTVASQNSLEPRSGNVFAITQDSGDANLKIAGEGGSGVIVAGSLEGSTSDIAEELTRTIGIQSNYNANATLISTIKDMEEELNRRI